MLAAGGPLISTLLRRTALVFLAVCQTLAYYFYLPLGMGPHVILEPWLLRQGWSLYRELPDHHTPLMPLLMSLAQRFSGEELRAGKLVLVALLLLTLLLVYRLTARIASENAALWAALFFVCWSPVFQSGQLRFEAFLTPLYLLAWDTWLPAENGRRGPRDFLAGFILGIAFLVKQHAAVTLVLFLGWQVFTLLRQHQPTALVLRTGLAALAGFCGPVLIALVIYLAAGGSLGQLLFWTVTFNNGDLARLLALAPTPADLQALLPPLLLVPAYLAIAGRQIRTEQAGWGRHGMPLTLLLSGILLALPRYGSEHLQPALPGLAMGSGLVLEQLRTSMGRELAWRQALVGTLLAFWLLFPLAGVIQASPPGAARTIHEYSLLPPLAEQVRQQIGPDECPYLMPEDEANSNLHFFLGCQPPGRLWLFSAYPWFSRFDLPEQALNALQTAAPRWVLYFPERWRVEEHNPRLMAYVTAHYDQKATFLFESGTVWLMEKR